MYRIKKQYAKKTISLKGVPVPIEETLSCHPSFDKMCKRWPVVLEYFEKIPTKKKSED